MKKAFEEIKKISALDWETNYTVVKNSYEQDSELLEKVDPLGNRALFDDFCDHFNTLCRANDKLYEVYFVWCENGREPLFWQELKERG